MTQVIWYVVKATIKMDICLLVPHCLLLLLLLYNYSSRPGHKTLAFKDIQCDIISMVNAQECKLQLTGGCIIWMLFDRTMVSCMDIWCHKQQHLFPRAINQSQHRIRVKWVVCLVIVHYLCFLYRVDVRHLTTWGWICRKLYLLQLTCLAVFILWS